MTIIFNSALRRCSELWLQPLLRRVATQWRRAFDLVDRWRQARLLESVPRRQERWELRAWRFAELRRLDPEAVTGFLWQCRERGTVELLDKAPEPLLLAYCQGRSRRRERDTQEPETKEAA